MLVLRMALLLASCNKAVLLGHSSSISKFLLCKLRILPYLRMHGRAGESTSAKCIEIFRQKMLSIEKVTTMREILE